MTEQQYPTREQIAHTISEAVGGWNQNMQTIQHVADAVLALFPQPEPSAEPPLVQVGGRQAGKTLAAIDALLDRANERGIRVHIVDASTIRDPAEGRQVMEAETYDCPTCGTVYLDANGNGRICQAVTPPPTTPEVN